MLQAHSIRQAQQAPIHLFHRPELARSVAKILMSDAGQRGMLLSGPRQTGKSTFVQWDLIPLLAGSHGAHVVYIDLSADCDVEPAVSIRVQQGDSPAHDLREVMLALRARFVMKIDARGGLDVAERQQFNGGVWTWMSGRRLRHGGIQGGEEERQGDRDDSRK